MIKRKLMLVERIMYVDSSTPLNCVFAAKINGEIAEENFKTALAKIQQKHPLLRAVIENDDARQPSFVLKGDMEPIALCIVERKTSGDWLLESQRQWLHVFEDPKKPLAQLVWIKGHEVSEIIWVMPHCICDGATCVTLMRELLCLLDDPSFVLEPYPMFHSVDDFLPRGFGTKGKKRRAKLYLGLARLFFFIQPRSKKRNLGDNYVIHWKLDTEITTSIIQRCKSHGVSVHAVLCAAFMQAFQQIQGRRAKRKVICPVDIRHFIPEIKQDHLFAFAPTIELSLKKGTKNLWDGASGIKQELVDKIQKLDARELLWMGERMHPILGRMISLLKSSKGGHDVTLSNMGKIDIPDTYTHFKVETIYSPTVAFPWLNSSTLVASTYQEQLDFAFMSNADFLPREIAAKIKDRVIELLSLPI